MADDARYIELVGQDGRPKALLVGYGSNCSRHIIERWRQRPQESPRGNINASVVDQISRALPTALSAGLTSGSVFQVVGTPALVEGIRAGTHALMQTGGASLGTVVSTSSGQIAGQLRFAPSSMAPVIAPLAVWSVLNGIAGTLQLHRINRRLDVMTRKIESLAFRQEAETLGRVFQAIKTLDDLLDEYFHTGAFTQPAMTRLAIVEQEIGSVLERNKLIVEYFSERARVIQGTRGTQGAEQSATLLQEEGSTTIHDMQLLSGLISAQSRIQEAHLFYSLMENPNYVDRHLEKMQGRVEEHKAIISGFPSITELQNHARQCVDEMNWFQKNIFNRSTVSRVGQTEAIRDPFTSSQSLLNAIPSYCFWRDENGLNVRIDRSGQSI